jgi:hypothetical protein
MSKIVAGIFAVLALMVVSTTSIADDRDFVIVNATGYPMKFVGVNAPGDEVWNENELSGILADGARIPIKFTGADKGCVWNLKVTWTDDSSSFFRGLNLCTINTVTLRYNRATDTASYVTD